MGRVTLNSRLTVGILSLSILLAAPACFSSRDGVGFEDQKDAGKSRADAGSQEDDGGEPPEACGDTVCQKDEYCCNPSCGICAPIGGGCIALYCEPKNAPCSRAECGPAMGIPSKVCSDGSVAGPICERDETGACGWVLTECPSAPIEMPCGVCEDNQYCLAPNCGRKGEIGQCVSIDPNCDSTVDDPVCGCDGISYTNPCKANDALAAIDYQGPCSIACPEGFADCNGDPTDGCEADLSSSVNCGACGISCSGYPCVQSKCSVECPAGYGDCDGIWENGCESSLTTTNNCGACGIDCGGTVCIDGKCSTEELNCGGFSGFTCADSEYCDYAVTGGCDAPESVGICRTKPENCTRDYRPVCGCDSQTYGNPCNAASAGVSVAYEGECKTGICTFGRDWTCNDNLALSSTHGKCNEYGSCNCAGWGYNVQSGRCL